MGVFIRHEACEDCGSSDGKAVYDDASSHCFVCQATKASKEFLDSVREEKPNRVKSVSRKEDMESKAIVSTKPAITEEEKERVKNETSIKGNLFRGVRDDVFKMFGVRQSFDENADVLEQYYPCTQEGQLVGYKIREVPKNFRSIGRTGADCELFMQFKFNRGGKYCVPMSTKALTRRGWLGYDEITTDDYVLAYDIEDGTKKWTKVLEKHLRSDLEVFEFGVGKQKLQSTENHRWLVSQKTSGADKRDVYFKTEYRTLADINTASGLIVNTKTNENISTSVSDLSANKYGINWVDRVISMSQEQRISFLDGVLLSDGCFTKNGWEACQNDGPLFEGILLACYLVHDKLVRVKKSKPNHKGNVMKHIVLSRAKTRSRLKEHYESKGVQDTWCITTALDSWVIRQGDFITLTGNCLLVEGEVDSLSAYQMLADYNKTRSGDFETAVVSATTGANSKKQVAAQYKFFDSFENIILCMDNDQAGQKAAEELIKHLPKGKVKLMQMRFKDPNEYLTQGKQKEFVSDFYNAKTFVPVGVLPSGGLYDRIVQQTEVAKVPFPPFMKKLNEMFIGGMPLGYIFNVAADTGVGKTTYVNEMIYYWIFNSPHKIGIVSMELDAGQYGEVLLSRHISRKLALMPDISEKLKFLASDDIKKKSNELMFKEDGNDRFFLLDNRDGTVEEIQDTIEELVVACNCKVIILDPLQDILDGLSNEEQAVFMKWAKGFIKSHGITFVFINHMRKSENSGEMDIMGSSTIIKSAGANIILKRDKLAEDPVVRNTTTVFVPKNRICGLTGPAGAAYYDNQTHTLYDLEDFLNGQI